MLFNVCTYDESCLVKLCVILLFQIRNSKASHLCVDQGMKENHTATLHPCHGWGPQVQRGHQKLSQTATECNLHHFL